MPRATNADEPAAKGRTGPLTWRYAHIDALRGLALSGVLVVNLETLFRIPLLEHIAGLKAETWRAERVVDQFVSFALEFKELTIFSFLFGAGIAGQPSIRGRGNDRRRNGEGGP